MKLIFAALFYVCAIFSIWLAFEIAPDMVWPATDAEWLAAHLLFVGLSSKMLGHILLLTWSPSR